MTASEEFTPDDQLLLAAVLRFPHGIDCLRSSSGQFRIIVKLPVYYLLPIRINRGFKIHPVPVKVAGRSSLGLMCAFHDDADEPLKLWRQLEPDPSSLLLRSALLDGNFQLLVFDEQNRERLGYQATATMNPATRARLAETELRRLGDYSYQDVTRQGEEWFAYRTAKDDAAAISLEVGETLYPEQEDDPKDASSDDPHARAIKDIVRIERTEPGIHQERDILGLLRRVFPAEQIFHSPLRHDNGREIADVLVITENLCLAIQAKDSPNTPASMRRALARKRSISVQKLGAAVTQLRGTTNFINRPGPLRFHIDGEDHEFEVKKKTYIAIAVVRELFNDSYAAYSAELFRFFDKMKLPCLGLDYDEFHRWTTFLTDEEMFVNACLDVFETALKLRTYPRLNFTEADARRVFT